MSDSTSPKGGPAVMELAMEMGLTSELLQRIADRQGPVGARYAAMSTSVGGIGPLLRERIITQAEQGIRVWGVSLLYETVWVQNFHGWDHLFLMRESVGDLLREALTDTGLTLNLTLFNDESVTVKVWKADFGGASVYYLDCPVIADVVYPCQEDAPRGTPDPVRWADDQRLKQSWLAGRGALALAKSLNFRPDVVVLSETPTLFAHHSMVQDEFQKDPFFENTSYIFNDHTPLEYAHPIWPQSTLRQVKMEPSFYEPYLKWQGDAATLDITRLLVAKADGVYGVSQKHVDVMRAMPSLKDFASKIQPITNGVLEDVWQHPDFRHADELSDQELLRLKEKLKKDFWDWLWRRARLWPIWLRETRDKALLLWTRRITSYKRLDILQRVLSHADMRDRFLKTDLILVVGGRIYQRDNISEKMVYNLVDLLNKDELLSNRVIFLDNFNLWEAPRLYQGADGAVMLADDGREASATGFMKCQLNGGLIIANADGAIPEYVHFKGQTTSESKSNGFEVSYTQGEPDVESFIKALEEFARVYRRPEERAVMMRAALAVTSGVSVRRTTNDMARFYDRVLKKRPAAAGR